MIKTILASTLFISSLQAAQDPPNVQVEKNFQGEKSKQTIPVKLQEEKLEGASGMHKLIANSIERRYRKIEARDELGKPVYDSSVYYVPAEDFEKKLERASKLVKALDEKETRKEISNNLAILQMNASRVEWIDPGAAQTFIFYIGVIAQSSKSQVLKKDAIKILERTIKDARNEESLKKTDSNGISSALEAVSALSSLYEGESIDTDNGKEIVQVLKTTAEGKYWNRQFDAVEIPAHKALAHLIKKQKDIPADTISNELKRRHGPNW